MEYRIERNYNNFKSFDHELNENELLHSGYKYVDKKMVNGKWRYYYDDIKSKIDSKNIERYKQRLNKYGLKNEGSRVLDNEKYYSKSELYKRQAKNTFNKLKNKNQRTYKNVKKLASSTIKLGKTKALRLLNNIGSGTLDNKIRKSAKKGRQYLSRLGL